MTALSVSAASWRKGAQFGTCGVYFAVLYTCWNTDQRGSWWIAPRSTLVFTGSRTIRPPPSPSIAIVWPATDVANSAKASCPARLGEPIVRYTFSPSPSALGPAAPGAAGSGKTSSRALPMLLTNRGSMYGPVR